MHALCPSPADCDERLYQVIADFLDSAERRTRPDPAVLLRRNPEFGPELREFLEAHDLLEQLTAPVRCTLRDWLAPLQRPAAVPNNSWCEPPPPGDRPICLVIERPIA